MSSQNVETVIIDENTKVVGLIQDVGQIINAGQEVITVNQPAQSNIIDTNGQPYHINTVPTNLIQTAVNQPVNQTHIVQCLNLSTVSTQTDNTIISYLPPNQIHLNTAQHLTKPIGNLQVVNSTTNSNNIVLHNAAISAPHQTLPLQSIGQPQNFSNMVLVQNPTTVVDTVVESQQTSKPSQPEPPTVVEHQSVETEILTSPPVENPKTKTPPTYFCVGTLEEVEERIRKHSEETFSHFVVAKKTKSFGSPVVAIDINTKFRVHWQSRDLTSTEECAVQIPYEGTPFVYIGEKAYMCHLGRNKATKNKEMNDPDGQAPKKHRSRLTKKQGCAAKIFVKQIAKFPEFTIPNNTEYLRTQMSQKLRKALSINGGHLVHMINYIGTLPDISEHSNHPIGEDTPLREPIDPIIREKIIEFSWKFGEGVLPTQIKNALENYVLNELFKDKTPPSKQRRRFYPSEKDISNYIYKAKLLSKISLHEINIMSNQIKKLKLDFPDLFIFFDLEIDGVNADPNTFSEDIALKYSTATILNENRITFSCQSPNQQRLLKMYGKQVILIEISCEANTPFPLYGLFVPTNVDYQLVYLFMVQSRNIKCIRDGFRSIIEWNPDWKPKFLCVDHMKDTHWKHLSVFEEFLPECNFYINDDSRRKAWTTWLKNPFNSSSVYGDTSVLLENLNSIASSYTEETLNKAAQDLEDSEVWKLSEMLREWFSSEWLAEAKRWVVGYRNEEYMNMLHLDDTRLDDLQPIREEHFNCIKSKKIYDFVREYVTTLMPQYYQSYIEKNIFDYRKQCLTPVKSPSPTSLYLLNKPACVARHLNEQIQRAGSMEYTVSQVQPGQFIVQEKKEASASYSVSFGDELNFPSCGCIDWLKYKLPCVHFVAIFHGFQGWETLSSLYIDSPLFTLDFDCFDKEQVEQNLFISIQAPSHATHKQKGLASKKIEQEIIVEDTTNLSVNKLLPLVMPPKQVVLPLPVVNRTTIEFLANRNVIVRDGDQSTQTTSPETQQSGETQNKLSEDKGEGAILNTCENVCQELTNVIKKVDDRDMLQKVKLDLQFVLNDVDLELSKMPTDEQPNIGEKRKINDSTGPIKAGNEPEAKKKIPDEERPSIDTVETSNTSPESEVWLDDPELDIKLYRHHQELILNNDILSMDIIRCVQKILRHQFHDVTGFADPELLEALNPTEIFGSDKKVLQLHRVEGHWATSARIGRNIHIFCCTVSSKASIIQQVLKTINESGIGDNILFIERPEENPDEHMRNCCLHSIAYCVSFAFDIEARNMIFNEGEMRSHLSECLEDMCFSMFPSKLIK